MIYFITFNEGGYFIAVGVKETTPEAKINFLSNGTNEKFIALFKNGKCFDGFAGRWRKNKKRNLKKYNDLMKNISEVPKLNFKKL